MVHDEPASITLLPFVYGLCHKQIGIFYIAHADGVYYDITEADPFAINTFGLIWLPVAWLAVILCDAHVLV